MARIIHRVFVSSTYEDLREERAEVQKALLKLDLFPVGMELFPSGDEETWDFIKQQIKECDYYIVVVAGRYGSMAPNGQSFTQNEWDYAREVGKPSLAFLHANPGSLPADKTELNPDGRIKLSAFLEQLKRHPITTYTNPHELAAQVMFSLVNLRVKYPTPGYVRADEAADLKKYVELLEENSLLKAQLAETAKELLFASHSDEVTLNVDVHPDKQSILRFEKPASLGDIFVALADALFEGIRYQRQLGCALTKTFFPEIEKQVSVKEIGYLLKEYFALGMVNFEIEESPIRANSISMFHGTQQVWHLTDYGRRQFSLLRRREI